LLHAYVQRLYVPAARAAAGPEPAPAEAG
jgi:hypothetical protein